MGKLSLHSKDILLLLLYAPTDKQQTQNIIGRTRLIKLMFLFQKEIFAKFKTDDITLGEIKFEAWNFGPWSKDVYDDVEFLKNIDFLTVRDSGQEASYDEAAENDLWQSQLSDDQVEEFAQEEFMLSELGKKFTKLKWDQLSDNQQGVLIAFKEQFNAVPLYALLQYVYTRYPESTINSKIKDKVLGRQ